jgi:hypothetical protein
VRREVDIQPVAELRADVDVVKLFVCVTNAQHPQAAGHVPGKDFQASLISACKVRAYSSGTQVRCHTLRLGSLGRHLLRLLGQAPRVK